MEARKRNDDGWLELLLDSRRRQSKIDRKIEGRLKKVHKSGKFDRSKQVESGGGGDPKQPYREEVPHPHCMQATWKSNARNLVYWSENVFFSDK